MSFITRQALQQKIFETGQEIVRQKQVLRRLEILLPDRLKSVRHSLRFQSSKKSRYALYHPSHLKDLEEILSFKNQVTQMRVQYENMKRTMQMMQSKKLNAVRVKEFLEM